MTRCSGAATAAHPLAVAAAREIHGRGGSAVDAAIGAQSVITVAMPHAAGLGGDMLALVHTAGGRVEAVNGAGRSPASWPTLGDRHAAGNAVTVPGAVQGWFDLHARFGRLPMADVLAPAARLARDGVTVTDALAGAVAAQGPRIAALSPECEVLGLVAGSRWVQPALAGLLHRIRADGPAAFYTGVSAAAVERRVRARGGSLSATDLAAHRPQLAEPVAVAWDGGVAHVQPPSSQGVLLAMALQWLDGRFDDLEASRRDHVMVELTNAVFGHRSDCHRGSALLGEALDIDVDRAAHRPGPRSYLHTAGVATAGSDGQVVSSLVSMFDSFGSGIWVPELGIFLNNRADGFTDGANSPRAGELPVHTLAPMLHVRADGSCLALATPGADGQVQTLLQVLTRVREGTSLDRAVADPRWRSEDGLLLVEDGHPGAAGLRGRGHDVATRPRGAEVFGSVAAAGLADRPFAVADFRRRPVGVTY